MNPLRIRWVAGALVVLTLTLAGCNKDNRRALAGAVTYDDKPLPYGTIQFDPDRSKGGSGPQGAGEIRDGRYRTNPNFGPQPGPHVVRITGWSRGPEEGMLPYPVVSGYEIRVEVPASGGELNFAIPSTEKK
jgi:hypothetical protein